MSRERETMLAAVKEDTGPGLVLKEVPRPSPGPGECLIKVRAAGICGTDLPIIRGERRVRLPLIPGHEVSGDIVEMGEGACGGRGRRVRSGDRVTVGLIQACGACRFCLGGDPSLCQEGHRLGITTHGGFAQYVTVPVENVRPLHQGMSYREGASVDPVACSLRAVNRALALLPAARARKKAWPGEYGGILVLGPGPIGLHAVQLLKALGAPLVALSGTRSQRLSVGLELGADEVINISETELHMKTGRIFGSQGPDLIIEATGNPRAVTEAVAVGGPQARVVLAGIFSEGAFIDALRLVRGEMILTGSFCYTMKEFEKALAFVERGQVKTIPLITHEVDLAQLANALDLLETREPLKVILRPWGETDLGS